MVETHRSTTTAASKYSSLSPSSSAAKQRRPRPQRAPVRARMRWRPREEEIAGGHSGGVNLPGTCSFLMAFSTALHSQWILLRSACALTPVCWSLVKKCQVYFLPFPLPLMILLCFVATMEQSIW
ncbi:Os11g0655000 [Oryza sativa Japonica Group]|uniref:Expressed protein n=3 Tax=Oryza sativa TaxID=4530 RepID=B7EU74_ORYSJ|nr:expressed protein [Oryza sativa Japonica Group]EEC68560.1 hypothetical protein OsI_36883 [Oryza sativa Indica Group]KAB8116019.1 hypothetical protein EE612_056944 [Oryza sativa]EEE52494.1 hypothetical protein OsJ_34690 [Oryza sativa Japonica Group]KAF2911941.1 hypothetical protein DAI22_11g218800 [Oryza sativa Japonica Group]